MKAKIRITKIVLVNEEWFVIMANISRRKKVGIWVLFIPVAIYIIALSIAQLINQPLSVLRYGLFLLLTILIAAFPIRMRDTVFNLIQGMSLATFIVFGLLPELLLSFIGILAVLIRSKIGSDQHYRYPINILATWISSTISAGVYFLTLNLLEIPSLAPFHILSMAGYLITYNLINQLLGVLVGKFFYNGEKVSFFNEELLFSLKVTSIILPSAFIVVYLHESLGTVGVLFAAFPFIAISVVTQYYYKSKTNNQYLTKIAEYSQMLAIRKSRKHVIKDFMDYTLKIFPSKQVFYFKIQKEKFAVLNKISILDGKEMESLPEIILTENSPLMEAFNKDTATVFHHSTEWRNKAYYNKSYHPESAVVLPIKLKNKNIGLIVITHPQRKIYDDLLVSMIGMFYQYFRIVLETIYDFEVLEDSNYTDYLTNLPNLRGFYNYFDKMNKNKNDNSVSLIVLDLDHFKRINDTHGHAAGNDVLTQVAEVLNKFSSEHVFVARFGGEEFILLIQNLSKAEAYQLTENIRQAIERTVFKIDYSIETGMAEEIRATASFGLATYPDDVKDIHSLVQLADRAMYLGSKQTGRNKITMHK